MASRDLAGEQFPSVRERVRLHPLAHPDNVAPLLGDDLRRDQTAQDLGDGALIGGGRLGEPLLSTLAAHRRIGLDPAQPSELEHDPFRQPGEVGDLRRGRGIHLRP